MIMNFDWGVVDWWGLLKAVVKAAIPFLSGAVGGALVGGCSVMGTGLGVFV